MFKKTKWDNSPQGEDPTIEQLLQSGETIPRTSWDKGLLLLYLMPIFGCFPALWTLAHPTKNREQMRHSRLSITLGSTWLLAYMLLTTGAATSEFLMLRLLILNSLLTSGYFLASFWLIIQVLQGKSAKLPGFSRLGAQLFRK
jgi:hypothetical protein